VTSQFCRN